MNQHGCRAAAAVLLALGAGQAAALERDLARAAGAAAGVAASIYVHEVGHAIAFRALGATEVTIRVPGDQCRLLCGVTQARLPHPLTPPQQRWTSAAGLLSANLVGEALLDRRAWAGSGLGQGYLAGNLGSNLIHVYQYYTRRVGVGGYRGNDIDQFEAAGGNPHLLSAALVGYTAYSLKRMHDRRMPLLFTRITF